MFVVVHETGRSLGVTYELTGPYLTRERAAMDIDNSDGDAAYVMRLEEA